MARTTLVASAHSADAAGVAVALSAAIARYPHTEALLRDPMLDMAIFPVITRAFAPMVRDRRFDVCELAIATFLQARAHGSDLVLLPIALSARFQNAALLCRASDPVGPADLRGRRVGVRAYSQTTGLWLRGILQEETGIAPQDMRWTTFEDAHVAEAADPAWATRASPGSDMLAMLRDGALDCAIFGTEMPAAPDLVTVWPDPEAAGQAFRARHGFVPVNHMLALRADVAARPGVARAIMDRVGIVPGLPRGRAALDPAVTLAVRFGVEQGLLPRALSLDEVWAGLPADCAA